MNLEDHLGDIVAKARQMANISAELAATASGLTLDQFEAFECSDSSARPPNWKMLAGLVGLHPAKLERIARGWRPAPIDLSLWRELRPITTTAEGITVNCYLIWDEVTREAALFDTGWQAAPIVALIQENQLQLKHLFLTHTHMDHIAVLGEVRERFPKVRLHSSSKNAPPDQRN